MGRRRPLAWLDLDGRAVPACETCAGLMLSPLFVEAVYSTAIERPGDPQTMARGAVEEYHRRGHA